MSAAQLHVPSPPRKYVHATVTQPSVQKPQSTECEQTIDGVFCRVHVHVYVCVCVRVCVCVQGREDAQGNMDLKVAGTSEGITSLQVTLHIGQCICIFTCLCCTCMYLRPPCCALLTGT